MPVGSSSSTLDSGAFLRRSALRLGDGQVGVTFANRDGETVRYVVTADSYRAVPLGTPATPDDYQVLTPWSG